MLDGVSLDQLRTFIATVEEGSFSAAARKLRRAQSLVSALVSGLEGQISVRLFDRSGRYPRLTPEGDVILRARQEITESAWRWIF
jgi:DNA-binding transcriptional LysR family regulator